MDDLLKIIDMAYLNVSIRTCMQKMDKSIKIGVEVILLY